VDNLPLLGIIVTADPQMAVTLMPWFTDLRSEGDNVLKLENSTALLARKHPESGRATPGPWLAVGGNRSVPVRQVSVRGNQFSPVLLSSRTGGAHVFCFAVGESREEALTLARSFPEKSEEYLRVRKARMQQLLDRTHTTTGDEEYDRALAWAKISLDALIMNYPTRGIFAGLPWFNNYWGRDTFISLPGAALVTGNFSLAREILVSFAEFQQKDSNSSDYGRIPNIVSGTDVAYNTADGTPRFIAMGREYVERSGDTAFVREIYPVVHRSIEGTLKFHTDSLGFLTHGDAETWMDAVGPEGPWSPRGNRANDIQALWERQLAAGIWFARLIGDERSAGVWEGARHQLAANFTRFFVSDGIVADHLDANGTRDKQVRPNQIFTTALLDWATRVELVRNVTTSLTYPHGVASLSQDDMQFHPYHQFAPYYPKDAAYHNGIVWTWLQGRLISELVLLGQQNLAYRLTRATSHQILERGAAGTQSELLDAAPRPGEVDPRLSGTFSQAWNLAENIRNFYDDYLGIRANLLERRLVLRPGIPGSLTPVNARVCLGDQSIRLQLTQTPSSAVIRIDAENLDVELHTSVTLPHWIGRDLLFDLPPRSIVQVKVDQNVITLHVDSTKQLPVYQPSRYTSTPQDSLQFLSPRVKPDLPSLVGPEYPLLSHATIKSEASNGVKIIDVQDPLGDDRGVGACSGLYTYPRSTQFVPGSFDIARLQVDRDSSQVHFQIHFKSLSNPGWHPEYGFQLTYAALAIDTDRKVGSGSVQVGHNSGYRLDPRFAYERLILVGGGIQLEDNTGRILAAYVPAESDTGKTLGNAAEGVISFSLPVDLLGEPNKNWHFTLLAGGQDDHGGAGLGEFRQVQEETSEWHGGGRNSAADINVYDELQAGPSN
jgi:glycogen debranching enzyme